MEGLLNGRYRLGDPLVHEGPGELFAAQDLLTGASCQVRVLAAQAPKGALGPLLEGRVRHPHIEAVLGSEAVLDPTRGTSTGRWLVASERVEGETLGALPDQAAALARVGLGVLAALEGLAALGLCHGGLTPSRLLLTPGGVKLLDPGLHALSGEEPRYPAPEGRRDARADLYALGACLYEHATGRVPDPRHPIPLRELRGELPPSLERAVALLLEEDPRRRAELDEVRGLLGEAAGSGALSPSRLPPTIDPSWVGRRELLGELEALATEAQTAAAAGRAARSAAPGPPTFLRLVAPAGYGKSRLLAEAGRRLCARDVVVLSGRVFEARDPAGAWRALLERAAAHGPGEQPERPDQSA
ncbi:MAG TPA: hypothetical protein DEA08_35180 [Planctomycetes bacterium]|nr:hypothetical protein [Planctomycetota bacterium]